ncbi:structural maintenance of chromosomes flexible hinge domain-containing protein 1 [Oryzias latipes]|uniref:structural maintenance of chromosomes flexible hinge domain-containing protein 1 n=1 Tax=Oryzias latipes TaxID=8090 RepID=UPI000CE28CCB|nr:structural maintenance of chromosomes flexible hinge domain-containing protein 1 [Oryzias latipes]
MHRIPAGAAAAAALLKGGRPNKRILVYDCRDEEDVASKVLETRGLDFHGFLQILHKSFGIDVRETFALVTTDRVVVDQDRFDELQDDCTLHLLQHEGQTLPTATEKNIMFTPHYDTLIKSGTHEYYSENQKSLPYALAELVDNSLSATARNKGLRRIEIRLIFDKTLGKHGVLVLDNGCGMTSEQLNNWAVYRLSKFTKQRNKFTSEKEGYVRPDHIHRSLNSDISYFGVGGKHAAFFIGDSVRMISKPRDSPYVHELLLSKEEFKRKEQSNQDVFSGTILNRMPGVSSHITKDERFLHDVIQEESEKQSFTVVVITGIIPDHIDHLKEDFEEWTRELAHIYHYYIHGANGNVLSQPRDPSQRIDIVVTLREKPPKALCSLNLREVNNDMQTLYINSAADTFEFQATPPGDDGFVEGVLRYHPFLYDKETYPKDPSASHESDDDDCDDNESEARGKRDIFECFWNGRLVPYTTVSEFDWCSRPKKSCALPAECFSRLSGVLFTNDKFAVSTNKLKFMELELKLRNKETIFTPIFKDQQKFSKRGNIEKEFMQWLQNCHERYDKQVKFFGFTKTITRTDGPGKQNTPWGEFSAIEWDGKIYRAGQLVKSQRKTPTLYGTVVRFLLCGEYDGDIFATGGEVEFTREPSVLYNEKKTMPISKIDRTASDEVIKKGISKDNDKLPDKLSLVWQEQIPWKEDVIVPEIPAGTSIGPLKVEILNRKGDVISQINTGGQGRGTMSVKLQVIRHEPKQEKTIATFSAPFVKAINGHWFKKIGPLTDLGKYTLVLSTVVGELSSTSLGNRLLLSSTHHFSIKAAKEDNFTVCQLSPTCRVGIPFNMVLQIKDCYGHPTPLSSDTKPVLKCSGLDISYETVSKSDTKVTIKGVVVRGKIQMHQQAKNYDLQVTLPGLTTPKQTEQIGLLPGAPHSLHVKEETVAVENGSPAILNVEIHDEAGNLTANPKQLVRYQVEGLKPFVIDCSKTGAGQVVTKPIQLNITGGEPQMLQVTFQLLPEKVPPVVIRLKVVPSSRVAQMEVYSQNECLVLKNEEKISWPAGGLLENLCYRLFDERGVEVPLTAKITSKIKVNWTRDTNIKDLVLGKLPEIPVPTQLQEERFCQVSYQEQNVSFSFIIVPCPNEPSRLKATLPQNTLKLGQVMTEPIYLNLVDQYDNETRRLTPSCVKDMTVEAEGLDKSKISFAWQQSRSSVAVTGVRFHSGPLGPRELCFHYSSFEERVIIKMTAGDPAELKLISGPEQPLQVLKGQGIPTPFLLQLCDEWGNPSPDQRVVVEIASSRQSLKLTIPVLSQPVDAEGKAIFYVNAINGAKGYHQLNFKGSFNNKPIKAPSVSLTVIPDPNKPVKLSVEYNKKAKLFAGGTFPVFSVTVVSDEGSPITDINPVDFSMLLWKGESPTPPKTVTTLKCSKPVVNGKNDCYYFREKSIPEQIGPHTIQFTLQNDKKEVLLVNQIRIIVVPNHPVKLAPTSPLNTPSVSYSVDVASRTLVENVTLVIMDKFGNPAGQNLKGKVTVSISCPDLEGSRNLPLFEGKAKSVDFTLEEGKAHISRLALMEKSPGENGSTYVLIFHPHVSTPLDPFQLNFHFYNDVENQRNMSELTKKKENLTAAIIQFDQTNETFRKLQNLYGQQSKNANNKVTALRNDMSRRGLKILPSVSIASIEQMISEKTAEAAQFERAPRRVCSIPNNFSGPDVLGVVGHLALIEDDEAARVISWHLRGDMDCVITRTTEAARSIYADTHGNQQVMPLDSISNYTAERPLPHTKNGRALFAPAGNPVYARHLLICPKEKQICDTVFKNLLGETIVMDDLNSATNYRREVLRNQAFCPTILTRDGNRVSAKGKFGGSQNKAPRIEGLQVFSAPFPKRYYALKEETDMLLEYFAALTKKEKAEEEQRNHLKTLESPEMMQKQEQVTQMKMQLQEIEKQLASVRPQKRPSRCSAEPSNVSKRQRGNFFSS